MIDWFYIKIAFEKDAGFAMETVAQVVVLKDIKLAMV